MALNASRDGKPLYESMGYSESAQPDDVFADCQGIILRLRA